MPPLCIYTCGMHSLSILLQLLGDGRKVLLRLFRGQNGKQRLGLVEYVVDAWRLQDDVELAPLAPSAVAASGAPAIARDHAEAHSSAAADRTNHADAEHNDLEGEDQSPLAASDGPTLLPLDWKPLELKIEMFASDAEICKKLGLLDAVTPGAFVQKVHELQATGRMSDGMKIGDMFDAFVKRNVETLFPPGVLSASEKDNDSVDCIPGPQSTTRLPLEAKYFKFTAGLIPAKHDPTCYAGLQLSARIHYSTAKRFGALSEFDLVNDLQAHQLILK